MGEESHQPYNGYGPSRFRKFSGKSEDFENFEHTFRSAVRLHKLHFAFDEYALSRPKGFDLKAAKQDLYDHLSSCLDDASLEIVRRTAKDDGVAAIQNLRKHHLRETDMKIYSHIQRLFTIKMEDDVSTYLCTIEKLVGILKNRI